MVRLFLLFSVALLVCCRSDALLRDDGSEERDDDSDEFDDDREVQLVYTANSIEFQSYSKTTSENEIDFHLVLDSALKFKMEYHVESVSSESEAEQRVNMIELIEYAESAAVPDGYTEGFDRVVQTIVFEPGKWHPISTPGIVTTPNGNQYTFKLYYSSLFEVDLIFAEYPFSVGDGSYDPTMVKMNVVVKSFPYREAGTFLALRCKSQSNQDIDDDGDDDDENDSLGRHLGVSGGGAQVLFGWSNVTFAANDEHPQGLNVTVWSSPLVPCPPDPDDFDDGSDDSEDKALRQDKDGDDSDDSAYEIVYSYDMTNPFMIYWDPVIGVTGSGTALVARMLAIVIATVVAAAL